MIFCAVCAAEYFLPVDSTVCVLCGDLQLNTFKSIPGNVTICTPCGLNTVPNTGYTACGMLIFCLNKL